MDDGLLAGWPTTVSAALALQERLRSRVELAMSGPAEPRTVAGLDVAYGAGGRLAGAAVVLDAATLQVVDQAVSLGEVTFPYVPGLFAFRELPALISALRQLRLRPDVLVCDGHGIAHPRRFGLACHIGVLTGWPAIGVAKAPLAGRWDAPGRVRGDWSPLLDGADTVGRVLRTQDRIKPVFVSVGHRMSLENACALVLAQAPRYRLPETLRLADRLCRAALAGASPR